MDTLTLSDTVTFNQNPQLALKQYHELGYHIEPNLWTAQECDELIAAAQNLPTYQDGSFKPVMHPHRIEPQFLAALKNQKIIQILELLVQCKVSAIQSQFFFGRPRTKGFAMHQDNYYKVGMYFFLNPAATASGDRPKYANEDDLRFVPHRCHC